MAEKRSFWHKWFPPSPTDPGFKFAEFPPGYLGPSHPCVSYLTLQPTLHRFCGQSCQLILRGNWFRILIYICTSVALFLLYATSIQMLVLDPSAPSSSL